MFVALVGSLDHLLWHISPLWSDLHLFFQSVFLSTPLFLKNSSADPPKCLQFLDMLSPFVFFAYMFACRSLFPGISLKDSKVAYYIKPCLAPCRLVNYSVLWSFTSILNILVHVTLAIIAKISSPYLSQCLAHWKHTIDFLITSSFLSPTLFHSAMFLILMKYIYETFQCIKI